MKIPLASTRLRSEDIAAAVEVLNSGNLTMGKRVRDFEQSMADYLNVNYFIMMNSGSSANLAMFEALLRPTNGKPHLETGDLVLVPVIAWPTTIWPLLQLGLKPIFIDVNPETFAIDLVKAQNFISQSTAPVRAVFPIHPLGRAIDPSELQNFIEKNDLILINDVCESLGSWTGACAAGTTGLGGSFSFYFSHHITTMEGGGVATNDLAFADDLRSIRSHGWSRDRSDAISWQQNLSNNNSKFLFVSTGYNIRPMEIQAAIGISQLKDLDQFILARREIARKIYKSIEGSGIRLVGASTLANEQDAKSHSWMLMPIQVVGANPGPRKLRIIHELEALGIETRPVLTGNFLSQPAMQRIGKDLPHFSEFESANAISESTFLVSGHHDLNHAEIDYLSESLSAVARNNP